MSSPWELQNDAKNPTNRRIRRTRKIVTANQASPSPSPSPSICICDSCIRWKQPKNPGNFHHYTDSSSPSKDDSITIVSESSKDKTSEVVKRVMQRIIKNSRSRWNSNWWSNFIFLRRRRGKLRNMTWQLFLDTILCTNNGKCRCLITEVNRIKNHLK